MTKQEKENWVNSIQNSADEVARQLGWETVRFVLKRYGASCIEQLNHSHYQDVFSELYAIEADLSN